MASSSSLSDDVDAKDGLPRRARLCLDSGSRGADMSVVGSGSWYEWQQNLGRFFESPQEEGRILVGFAKDLNPKIGER